LKRSGCGGFLHILRYRKAYGKVVTLSLAIDIFGKYYLPLNRDTIQIIIAITTITEIIPTTAPALKIPSITEQLLKQNSNNMSDGKYNFFMVVFYLI
jgi:hypothetical protein